MGWFTRRVSLAVKRLRARGRRIVQGMFPDYIYRRFPRTLFGTTRTFLWSASSARNSYDRRCLTRLVER